MTTNRPLPRIRWEWQDLDARPLPDGYLNLWRGDDGTALISRCPALLVQERKPYWEHRYADMTRAQMVDEGIDPDHLERRVVAAVFDAGALIDATDAKNYLGVLHRDELADALRQHGLTLPERIE